VSRAALRPGAEHRRKFSHNKTRSRGARFAIFGQFGYREISYQSQMDGLWRFAAPFSFSLASLAPGAEWRPATEGKFEMTIGTVKFFNEDKGYGFIAPEGGGNDAFVHISAVERAGMRTLDRDQRVSYDLETDQRGKTSAVNIQAA
jgi:CspA family cold shock protein